MDNKEVNNNVTKKRIPISLIIMIAITVISFIICAFIAFIPSQSDSTVSGLAVVGIVLFYISFFRFIWTIYVICFLLYKLLSLIIKKPINNLKAISLIIVAIGLIIMGIFKKYGNLWINTIKVHKEEQEISEKGKISSIEYDTVCIKEDGSYVPYVVTDNKYDFTKNSLLVRKNALNKTFEYFIPELYDSNEYKFSYEKTYIDQYLNSDEWLSKFDTNFLNIINDTKLVNSSSDLDNDTNLIRKFFIISYNEAFGFHTDAEWDKMAESGGMYKGWSYFDLEDLVYDDDGNVVDDIIYRIEKNEPSMDFCKNQICWDVDKDDTHKYHIRPAFTISNKTKITENKDKSYNCNWILDY